MGKKKNKFIPHDIENDYYINYSKKDGRYRAMNKRSGKSVSYPRLLMENHLGRYLDKNEDVHHKDGDKSNNNIDNLEVIDHVIHIKQHNKEYAIVYYDEIRQCPICKVWFQWTDTQQRNRRKNKNRKKPKYDTESDVPFCSKRCAGKYSKSIQIKYQKGELTRYNK